MNSKTMILVGVLLASSGLMSSATLEAADVPSQVVKVAEKPTAKVAEALTATQILDKAGRSLFPSDFSARLKMSQYKPGSEAAVSELMLYKKGENLVRADYTAPAVQAGQRMLRKEGQIWMYMPDTKRPIKLSPKQSLGGSDFNNGDLMRLNLLEDYVPTIASETATEWVLDLKAKDRSVSYDLIKYTISKEKLRSVKQEYYTLSGKMIKTLEFKDYKKYGDIERPGLFVMRSSLAAGVYTEMLYLEFDPTKTLPDSEFRTDALSKQ